MNKSSGRTARERSTCSRKLLKLSAAAGASTLASPWTFQSSRAAPSTVKIGMVSPETGPIAAFGEADQFVLAGVRKAMATASLSPAKSIPSRSFIRTVNQIPIAPPK